MLDHACIDAVEQNGTMYHWVRSSLGINLESTPADRFYYCFVPNNSTEATKYKDIYGRPMRQCFFDSRYEMSQFAKSEAYVCESDVPTKYKLLIDDFKEATGSVDFNFCLYDIEVDFDLADGKGYPKPLPGGDPYGEINAISAYTNHNNRYTMFLHHKHEGEVHLEDDDLEVDMVYCSNEKDILRKFAKFLDPVDVLAAWFGNGFDLPYIMNRAEILFGEDEALTMFCRDGFKATSKESYDNYGNESVKWQLTGRKHIDLMEIYKKFIPGQRPSFSLDAICEEDLDIRKVQYEDEGDLGTLYRENPQKFFEYSLHDARLLLKLDQKHNLMQTAFSLAVQHYVYIDDVTGSVKPIENGLIQFARKKDNIVLPDKVSVDSAKFPGAIVYDTISGRHEWTFSIDLGSLYPSAMIMLGLSSETMVAQLKDGYDDYVRVMSGSNATVTVQEYEYGEIVDVYDSKASDLKEAIVESGYTISANGTIFNGELGLIAEFVKDGIDQRKIAKREAKEFYEKKDMLNYGIKDLLQKVLKIRNNSTYGCIANKYFRLFNIDMAGSITLTGQVISKFQATYANELLEEIAD